MADLSSEPLRMGSGVIGKHIFRVRERHLADHLAPMITGRAAATAKLDLVLRCVALLPRDAGNRDPGTVVPRCSWELLHDLARGSGDLGTSAPGLDASPEERKLKRKWVGQQLARLEGEELLRREVRPGKRPKLILLRDDGSGKPFDDPDGSAGNTYVTILGAVIATRTLAHWNTQEFAAYLAATAAERYASGRKRDPGEGKWFRSLAWFADVDDFYGPADRVRIGFSEPTLERGIKKLEAAGLMSRERIVVAPGTNRRLSGPRNLYTNNFASLRAQVKAPTQEEVEEVLADEA